MIEVSKGCCGIYIYDFIEFWWELRLFGGNNIYIFKLGFLGELFK